MSTTTTSNPPAIHELFAYLCVRDTAAAIAFCEKAFGAVEQFRLVEPSGRIGHAEVRIGPSIVMLCDEYPEYGITGPREGQNASVTMHLHVDDADALAQRAIDAGATMLSPPADQFYGERSCRIRDPFGHTWLLGHSIEKLTPAEMQRRYTALMTE